MTLTAETALEKVKQAAISEWGEERWLVELTRRYNELYNEDGDTTQAFKNRRSQIGRIFDKGSCTADWLFRLAHTAGCKISIE